MTTPIDLFTAAVRLLPEGGARPAPRTFDAEHASWQLMAFHADTDADMHADHWEMHPGDDEVVACLSGGVRLCLRGESDGEDQEISVPAGAAVIVPRGRWHCFELDSPSDILALTVPRGTRLEQRTTV
ncbi:cupin domain-containing protein [Mycolicibacterium flavescens]|uniref:Cupin n=1 Tax=Mycolicibacterium flavescens TaxID=1776 RepID=A0A1E3R9M0_MYCFV|nr:cupin domain-containing protein [Mycolicibacterium flavescens]MCV7282005.1 cupin domain-containing protein [Mycolicibacterium flavescens]ODQ86062.1 cupin [Mycolicibacterium flavescens]